jgi:hypothetical protein
MEPYRARTRRSVMAPNRSAQDGSIMIVDGAAHRAGRGLRVRETTDRRAESLATRLLVHAERARGGELGAASTQRGGIA